MAVSTDLTQDARDFLRSLFLPVPGRQRLFLWELGAEPRRNGRFIYVPGIVDPNTFQMAYCALQIAQLFPDMDASGKHRLVDFSYDYNTPALTVWHTVTPQWLTVQLATRLAAPGEPYMIIRPSTEQLYKRG